MTQHSLRILVVAAALGLGGCSLFPTRSPEILIDHDFGPLHRHKTQALTGPVLLHAKSASWLAGTSIHYRLLYQDPTAIYVYANNRWAAPPATLLKARIRWRLGMGPNVGARPPGRLERLVLVISRFDQDFTTPHKAFARLTVWGRLYDVTSGALIATDLVDLRSPCAPNVGGAVTTLGALARTASADFARLLQKQETSRPKAKD